MRKIAKKPSLVKKLTTKDKTNTIHRIDEEDYEIVSLAVMQGNIDRLNSQQQKMFERTRAAYSIVCETPLKSESVHKLCALYPDISIMQAYRDIDYAIKIWNPKNRFDRDFLESILMNALIENIKNPNSDESARAKNMATLQRYLSSLPQENIDPNLLQKHNIFIQLNVGGKEERVSGSGRDSGRTMDITDLLDNEITDVEAAEILES